MVVDVLEKSYIDLFFCIHYFYIHLISPHIKHGMQSSIQGYHRFVQIGRVARVIYGPQEGKIATIVDILNDKRVLIDGENVERQIIPIRRLQLTKQMAGIKRGTRTNKVKAIFKKEKIAQNYADSSIGKSYAAQARRESLNDFERHKVVVLRRKLSKLTRAKVAKKK